MRTEANFSLIFINFDDALVAVHSSQDGLGLDFPPCNETTEFHPVDEQVVNSPSGAVHFHFLGKETFVTVYDWTDGFPDPFSCEFLNDPARIIVRGMLPFRGIDNNTTGGGPGINTSGFQSHGFLNVGGARVKYDVKRTFQFADDGEFRVRARVGPNLKPDPR